MIRYEFIGLLALGRPAVGEEINDLRKPWVELLGKRMN